MSINDAIAQRWGHLMAEMGRPLPAIDSLLAATALEHNLVLVTRNLKDVADLPVAESAYRLSVRAQDAGLDEAARTKRKRLDSWLDEQVRAQPAGGRRRERVDFLREAEQQDAYTLLNRLVILQLMEEPGPSDQPLRKPALIKGGWNSRAYQDCRDLARGVVRDDPTEGFGFLLQLVCEELETCWSDDMTLGWVYQYWNDPERERLDTKINDGGKIEPHEIASKTQIFTERYMVDWMLQNSMGLMCIDYSRGTLMPAGWKRMASATMVKKNCICIDLDHGFIRRYAIISANAYNNQMPQRLLDSENQHDFDWADSAYSGKCFEELLSLGGFESLIHEKRARNHPIRDADKELNRIKSAIRGLVCLWRHDHVNGWKAHEKIGLERMEAW